jgi:uncharacterized protein (TIGR02466 family)
MKHHTLPLFALPVTRVDLEYGGIAEFFDKVIKPKQGKSNTDGISGHETRLTHFHNDRNVFEIYDELKELGDRILKAANFVYHDVMNQDSELRVTNAWFSECAIGGGQFMHNHCNSALSGTLYLRTGEQSHLKFQSPYGLNDFGNLLLDEANTKRPNIFGYGYQFKAIRYKVVSGACLFWPSHLRHGYAQNNTAGRLALSFNFLPTTFNCVYNA